MSPDQVIEELKLMDVNITRRTLLRYEKAKLIPDPVRGGKGRGRGRVTEYPEETAEQAFAAYQLLHGEPSYKPESIARFRDCALSHIDNKRVELEHLEPLSLYWLVFIIMFRLRIDPSGKYWLNLDYVYGEFEADFKNQLPKIPDSVSLDFDNIDSNVTIFYFSKKAQAVKRWESKNKRWVTYIF